MPNVESPIKWLLALLWLTAAARPVAAQLTESDTLPWRYRVGVSGSYVAGNVDRALLVA